MGTQFTGTGPGWGGDGDIFTVTGCGRGPYLVPVQLSTVFSQSPQHGGRTDGRASVM